MKATELSNKEMFDYILKTLYNLSSQQYLQEGENGNTEILSSIQYLNSLYLQLTLLEEVLMSSVDNCVSLHNIQ